MTQLLSLHSVVRNETHRQAAVADLLATGGPRYRAAIELQQASDQLREAARVGLDTTTMRHRYAAAAAVWNALAIGQWAVTS